MNPEQKARRYASQVKYRTNNRDRVRATKKAWFDKNPGYFKEWTRGNYQKNPWKYVIRQIRAKCKKEGLPFDLTVKDIVVPDKCPVLGIPLLRKRGRGRPGNMPTIDRVIPKLGYVKGNVNVISFRANRLKNNASIDELRLIVAYMERHLCASH